MKDSSSSIVVDSLKVSNCVFVGNRAEIGGAIYVKDAQYIEISRNNFTHNNANSYGGDISGYLSKTQISDASFLVQSYFSINWNLFSWNQVVGSGGFGAALALGYTQHNYDVTKNTFNRNTAASTG